MSLTTLQAQLLPTLEHALQTFLDQQDFRESPGLKAMLSAHMGWESADAVRGKRIRPLLTLLTAGACGGDPQTALPAAVAVELLHNFTLIHDDIEDQSPLRHGRDTLWVRWGIAQAINAGDALFSIAQLALLTLTDALSPSAALQAAREFNQTCLHLTQGQYLDIAFETDDAIAVETYLRMIEGKTAALIAFAASVGALAAGASPHQVRELSNFGQNLGMAFQIQDDLLGIWGDPAVTGKSAASDLLTKKKTLPVLYGLQHCPDFKTLWKEDAITPDRTERLAAILKRCGAQAYGTEKAQVYTRQAYQSLETAFRGDKKRNPYVDALFALCDQLLNRDA